MLNKSTCVQFAPAQIVPFMAQMNQTGCDFLHHKHSTQMKTLLLVYWSQPQTLYQQATEHHIFCALFWQQDTGS